MNLSTVKSKLFNLATGEQITTEEIMAATETT